MKIDVWNSDDWETEYEKLKINDDISHFYLSKILSETKVSDMPETIEIETINRCNNDCSFCPVNRKDDKRKFQIMTDELFKKIIEELAERNYDGWLALFSNNEPFLDKRIIDFMEYARRKIPKCKLTLYTNGLLLDVEKYKKIIKMLNVLVIDNYNDDLKLNKSIEEIYNANINEDKCDVTVSVRKKNQILSSRGGMAPNKKNDYEYKSECLLPFIQMIIRPDGKVSKCCQDVYGIRTLGDINNESIYEIWNGEKYKELRKNIMLGRNTISDCKSCDLFGLTNNFDERWIYSYTCKFVEKIKNANKKIYVYRYTRKSLAIIELLKNFGIYIEGIKNNAKDIEWEKEYIIFNNYEEAQANALDHEAVIDFVVFRIPYVIQPKPDLERKLMQKGYSEILLDTIKKLVNNKFICFGAGKDYECFRKKYKKIVPDYVVDRRFRNCKKEKIIEGVEAKDINFLMDHKNEYIILITSSKYFPEIREELLKAGINNDLILNAQVFL